MGGAHGKGRASGMLVIFLDLGGGLSERSLNNYSLNSSDNYLMLHYLSNEAPTFKDIKAK